MDTTQVRSQAIDVRPTCDWYDFVRLCTNLLWLYAIMYELRQIGTNTIRTNTITYDHIRSHTITYDHIFPTDHPSGRGLNNKYRLMIGQKFAIFLPKKKGWKIRISARSSTNFLYEWPKSVRIPIRLIRLIRLYERKYFLQTDHTSFAMKYQVVAWFSGRSGYELVWNGGFTDTPINILHIVYGNL